MAEDNQFLSDITNLLSKTESTIESQENLENSTEVSENQEEKTIKVAGEAPAEASKEAEKADSSLTEEEKKEVAVKPFDFINFYRENKDNLELATTDLDKIDLGNTDHVADQLVKSLIREGYSEDEAYTLLEDKYPNAFGEDIDTDDDDVQKLLKREYVKMKSEAKTAIAELKARQAEININIPTGNLAKDSVIAEYQKEQQASYQSQLESTKTIRENIGKELSSFDKVIFDAGDDSTIEYELSKEDKDWVNSEIQTIDNFFSKNFSKKDGSLDKEALLKTLIAGKNIAKIIKIAKGQGSGEGRKDLLNKDFKNNTMQRNGSNSDRRALVGDSITEQGAQAIREGKIDISKAF
tara:strand:+ start:8507 stop:9565 length:1059 start_codon:yes stop_codon:yes gene_type:complete